MTRPTGWRPPQRPATNNTPFDTDGDGLPDTWNSPTAPTGQPRRRSRPGPGRFPRTTRSSLAEPIPGLGQPAASGAIVPAADGLGVVLGFLGWPQQDLRGPVPRFPPERALAEGWSRWLAPVWPVASPSPTPCPRTGYPLLPAGDPVQPNWPRGIVHSVSVSFATG